jgi:hypothetical protein
MEPVHDAPTCIIVAGTSSLSQRKIYSIKKKYIFEGP